MHCETWMILYNYYIVNHCFICLFTVFENRGKSGQRFCQEPFKVATACLSAFCLILLMILVITSVHNGTSPFSHTWLWCSCVYQQVGLSDTYNIILGHLKITPRVTLHSKYIDTNMELIPPLAAITAFTLLGRLFAFLPLWDFCPFIQ